LICKTFSADFELPFRLISFLISGKQFPRFYRVELRNKLISHAVALDTGICNLILASAQFVLWIIVLTFISRVNS